VIEVLKIDDEDDPSQALAQIRKALLTALDAALLCPPPGMA
jgi:hypothetical protein